MTLGIYPTDSRENGRNAFTVRSAGWVFNYQNAWPQIRLAHNVATDPLVSLLRSGPCEATPGYRGISISGIAACYFSHKIAG